MAFTCEIQNLKQLMQVFSELWVSKVVDTGKLITEQSQWGKLGTLLCQKYGSNLKLLHLLIESTE